MFVFRLQQETRRLQRPELRGYRLRRGGAPRPAQQCATPHSTQARLPEASNHHVSRFLVQEDMAPFDPPELGEGLGRGAERCSREEEDRGAHQAGQGGAASEGAGGDAGEGRRARGARVMIVRVGVWSCVC